MRALTIALLITLFGVNTWAQCSEDYSGPRGKALFLKATSKHLPSGKGAKIAKNSETRPQFVQGADPFVFQDTDETFYLFTTNRPRVNVPVYRVEDYDNLTFLGDALPILPSWAQPGHTWAPEVMKLNEKKYVLWYTASDKKSDKQCIGQAISDNAYGPFTDTSNNAFLCDEKRDRSIDPSPYRDADGKLFLLWKTKEVQRNGTKTIIWLSQMDSEGNLLPIPSKPLLSNDQAWEGEHIEAPTLLKLLGQYYLFYSAGGSTSRGYLVSYATSMSIEGPYTKTNEVVLGGNKCMRGAGHQTIVKVGSGEHLIYYHAVHPDRRETKEGKSRFLDFAHLCFPEGKPTVQDRPCSP